MNRSAPVATVVSLCVFAIVYAAGPAAAAPGPVAPAERKLILLSWDGAADWVVDRLLAEGRLPNLAALAARGVAAEHSLTSFPSKTAAGHAAVWTGCWGDCNGITGNRVPLLPVDEHSVVESRSGFSSEALLAEPFYITAARHGRRVVVLSATQSYPVERHREALRRAGVPAAGYRSFSGFEHQLAGGRMIGADELRPASTAWGPTAAASDAREVELAVGESRLYVLFYDDPDDPVRGLDRALVRLGSREPGAARAQAVLAPRPASDTDLGGWSPPLPVSRGELTANTFLRLFELAPDGSRLALYQRAAADLRGIHTAADRAAYRAAYPGFHDDPFPYYENGGFGLPLPLGGEGTAERRVLELVAHDLALAAAGTRFALTAWHPDLLLHYSPMSDGAGHTWLGPLDPAGGAYDAALAERLWPYYARVFELLDGWLGEVVAAAPPETVVALVSDHGMIGVRYDFYPNLVLEAAGLLARTAGGEIDLARTRALVADSGSGFAVTVNGAEHPGGIVPPGERAATVAAATAALLAARDPATGAVLVPRVFRPRDAEGLGGPAGADLYFDVAPGYYPRPGLAATAVVPIRLPWGMGHHGFWPQRRDMHAIFYAAGPGLARGLAAPPVRHIDVAPTLCRALGLPPPPQARGHVLGELLAPAAGELEAE